MSASKEGILKLIVSYLRTFIKVVQKGNLSEVAQDIHFTQPAVSKQLQALEKIYKTKLLQRNGKKIVPTEQGRVLFKYALEIMETLKEAESAVCEVKMAVKGNMHLASSTIPGQYILPYLIGAYKEKYPEVKVTLEVCSSSKVQRMLLNGEVDIGFIGAKPLNKQLGVERFMLDELVFILASNYNFSGTNITLEQLKKIPIVTRKEGSATKQVVEERLKQVGLEAKELMHIMEFDNTESVKTAVEAGIGGAFVSKWAVKKELKLGTLRILNVEGLFLERELYVAFLARKYRQILPDTFLSFLKEIDIKKQIGFL